MRNLHGLLLPTLFPSWRFFDQIGPSPRIEVCAKGGEWRAFEDLPVSLGLWQIFFRLFHSPVWNEHLYRVSTAIRLSVEPDDHALSELSRLIYRGWPGESGDRYRFRICYLARDDGRIGKFVEYESAELTVS